MVDLPDIGGAFGNTTFVLFESKEKATFPYYRDYRSAGYTDLPIPLRLVFNGQRWITMTGNKIGENGPRIVGPWSFNPAGMWENLDAEGVKRFGKANCVSVAREKFVLAEAIGESSG